MARLGLKLYYLRTRVRDVSQQKLADELGVRQATLSNIERGTSLPTVPLLIELCRYFDVTPTYFVDEERGVLPLPSERWSMRNSLVTVGMWVEVPEESLVRLEEGKILCPLLPGGAFYDGEAKEAREQQSASRVEHQAKRRTAERSLARLLQGELRAHPQRRGRSKS